MRTTTEIVARLHEIKLSDVFGFESGDLLECLPFDDAKAFLKPDASSVGWAEDVMQSADHDAVRRRMTEYLPFAFGKAIDHRGLSASRSVSHMRAWTWLLQQDELLTFINDSRNYAPYGAPILARVAQFLDVPLPDSEDFQRMLAEGACHPNCDSCRS